MTEQATLTLIPDEMPEWEVVVVNLDDLPPNHELIGPDPDPTLIESIRHYGHKPGSVSLSRKPDGTYEVHGGRRNIKALRILDKEYLAEHEKDDNSPWKDVQAVIVEGIEDAGGALGVALNATARANPASDLIHIEALEKKGYTESQISRATGMKIGQVRAIKNLTNLVPGLRQRFNSGKLSASAAKLAAKLSAEKQNAIHEAAGDKKIKYKDVQEARQVKRAEAQTDLASQLTGLPGLEDADTSGMGVPSTEENEYHAIQKGQYASVLYEDDEVMVLANGDWEVRKLPVASEEGEYYALQIVRRK